MTNRFSAMGKMIFIALLCTMLIIPTSLGGVTGQLWLEAIDGTYIEDHADSWIEETSIIGQGPFYLNITNHHQSKSICFIYLLTAVNSNPDTTISVKVNGIDISVNDWTPAVDGVKPEVLTNPSFYYPAHGIYQNGTWYNITIIDLSGTPLGSDESTNVSVVTSGGYDTTKIHFDAVGANCDHEPIVFVPPSHDVTSLIPEFPTIALPIAAILGLMFILQSRNRKKED